MFTISTNIYTANYCVKYVRNGIISLDMAIQRGEVWDNKTKSLFIHSMICNYPTQRMFASKQKGVLLMLDGKQRLSCIRDYMANEFSLSKLPDAWLETPSGLKECKISGKKFCELPEAFQDAICMYNIDICSVENATDDEIGEMFRRLNNGKSLTQFEQVRGKIPCLNEIKEISKHKVFDLVLSQREQDRYDADEIIAKTHIALNEEEPNFAASHVRAMVTEWNITEEQKQEVQHVYDSYVTIYESPELTDENRDKMSRKTNFLSLIPLVKENSVEDMIKLCKKFFTSDNTYASHNEEYNDCCLQGSTNVAKATRRVEILREELKKLK